MAAALEGRVQKQVHDLHGQARPDHAAAQGQDITVVVAAGHLGGEAVAAQGAADALDLVGRHGHADAGAAAEDALLRLAGGDGLRHQGRIDGVIAAGFGIGAVVGEGDAPLRQVFLDLFLEGKAPVVASQCNHSSISPLYSLVYRGVKSLAEFASADANRV